MFLPLSRRIARFLLFVLVFLYTQAVNCKDIQALSQHPQWLALLHYHHIGLLPERGSQIDDEDFFLAPNGDIDPLAELHATIELLTQTSADSSQRQCRYQARRHWLATMLPHVSFAKPDCPEFDAWLKELAPDHLVLVFPAAYLNSPSSMFGHTFIRIARRGGNNPLLDYSVNFAANANPAEDQFSFAIKGLFGGYAGQFSVMPYYQKTNEYVFLESRDMWEYNLTLPQETVDQFVRHIWELRNIDFDYYFLTENCSYQLLTAFDAADYRLRLSDDFTFQAKPVDTVRSFVSRGLISDIQFRPSSLSKIKHWQQHLSAEEFEAVITLTDPKQDISSAMSELSNERRAYLFEYAYHLLRYQAVKEKKRSAALNQRALALLAERSKLGQQDPLEPVPAPSTRDDQGHDSYRAGLMAGYNRSRKEFLELSLRPAYHDHLDPIAGFAPGARLEMFTLNTRLYEHEQLNLQRLGFINIHSLNPSNAHVSAASWSVGASVERDRLYSGLQLYLDGQYGKTFETNGVLASFLWQGLLSGTHDVIEKPAVHTGPAVELLLQTKHWSAQYKISHLRLIEQPDKHHAHMFGGIAWHIDNNFQLRMTHHRIFGETYSQSDNDLHQYESTLGFHYYY
ncbi:MAG: DUF4105 domain-containing protein [Oleiphilaceae bacterium]|nr:DUF4105 domain-containing protein [Oleiphilaceae bacterium]